MIQSKPNILFIVLDTCRYDTFDEVLRRGSLPNFSKLLDDSIYYKNAISPSSWTTPSHVSLFTGLYPSEHKVHETKYLKQSSMIMNQILNFPGKLLPEILRTNGYNTYGFVANPNLAPGSGFERGFDYLTFVDMFEELSELWSDTRQKIKAKFPRSEEEIIRLANNFDVKETLHFARKNWNFLKLPHMLITYREFLKKTKEFRYPVEKAGKRIGNIIFSSAFESPFFLFLNFMEMHDPYMISKGEFFSGEGKKMLSFLGGNVEISSVTLEKYKELYTYELILLDKYVGIIIDKLKKDGIYDDTIIVITADHGQNFGEEHFYGHGILLSDSLIKVPLIIKLTNQSKPPISNKYQPLTNLFKFLVRCSEGTIIPDLISDEVAYSESFGIQENYREMLRLDPDLISKLESYDHRSLAIYVEGMKVVVSVGENKFNIDSATSYEGNISLEKFESVGLNEYVRKFLGFRYESAGQSGVSE